MSEQLLSSERFEEIRLFIGKSILYACPEIVELFEFAQRLQSTLALREGELGKVQEQLAAKEEALTEAEKHIDALCRGIDADRSLRNSSPLHVPHHRHSHRRRNLESRNARIVFWGLSAVDQ